MKEMNNWKRQKVFFGKCRNKHIVINSENVMILKKWQKSNKEEEM